MGDWLNANATLDSIGDGVLSVDLSDVVTALNPSAESMTGWTRRDAIGCPVRSVLRIVDRDTRKPVPDPLRLAMVSGQSVTLTPNSLLLRRGGGEVPIEDSASPIRDGTGQVVGAVIVFRDVGNALEALHFSTPWSNVSFGTALVRAIDYGSGRCLTPTGPPSVTAPRRGCRRAQ